MMNVYYTLSTEARMLKLWVDKKTNTQDLTLEQAEQVAQDIADKGGYAKVMLGNTLYSVHGTDPRHI